MNKIAKRCFIGLMLVMILSCAEPKKLIFNKGHWTPNFANKVESTYLIQTENGEDISFIYGKGSDSTVRIWEKNRVAFGDKFILKKLSDSSLGVIERWSGEDVFSRNVKNNELISSSPYKFVMHRIVEKNSIQFMDRFRISYNNADDDFQCRFSRFIEGIGLESFSTYFRDQDYYTSYRLGYLRVDDKLVKFRHITDQINEVMDEKIKS